MRSLIRARDTVRELRERGEYGAGQGFAEAMAGFEAKSRPGRIWLVAPGHNGAVVWKTALDDKVGGEVRVVPRETALTELTVDDSESADVFVISADLTDRNDGLRLLSELRSRPATRHAATLMVLPEGDTERAAIAHRSRGLRHPLCARRHAGACHPHPCAAGPQATGRQAARQPARGAGACGDGQSHRVAQPALRAFTGWSR